jgi:hypothetical protein
VSSNAISALYRIFTTMKMQIVPHSYSLMILNTPSFLPNIDLLDLLESNVGSQSFFKLDVFQNIITLSVSLEKC